MKEAIIFMIRRRMGLKQLEQFQFANQKTNAVYYFTNDALMKSWRGTVEKSSVSLNWLLDDGCEIVTNQKAWKY